MYIEQVSISASWATWAQAHHNLIGSDRAEECRKYITIPTCYVPEPAVCCHCFHSLLLQTLTSQTLAFCSWTCKHMAPMLQRSSGVTKVVPTWRCTVSHDNVPIDQDICDRCPSDGPTPAKGIAYVWVEILGIAYIWPVIVFIDRHINPAAFWVILNEEKPFTNSGPLQEAILRWKQHTISALTECMKLKRACDVRRCLSSEYNCMQLSEHQGQCMSSRASVCCLVLLLYRNW